MNKTQWALSAALAIGLGMMAGSAAANTDDEAQALTQPQSQPADSSYEVKTFSADFHLYHIGDTVPELYRSSQYAISQWKLRNLTPPDEGTHWTYMGGNYVLITDDAGKVVKALSGDIFYAN
ncbi:RcnB family protein [Erwinia sp. HR93]|uniref:RcnB family protein n=1 Tax=Erwinia sp. HR93 TaxID=3094840 RepID=UPI002ADEC050|nr:RcnB family protein [Erwinia sp. HR93]MEA1065455.1 RcnB family protein [Erwinia sp. HR93]